MKPEMGDNYEILNFAVFKENWGTLNVALIYICFAIMITVFIQTLGFLLYVTSM
jgi:hypothetical protein